MKGMRAGNSRWEEKTENIKTAVEDQLTERSCGTPFMTKGVPFVADNHAVHADHL